MTIESLDALRQRGVRGLVAVSLAAVPTLALLGWIVGSPHVLPATLLATASMIIPTMLAIRRRYDAGARLAVGSLAAVLPALFVFLLSGQPWQMDAHMYFFSALAALTVLCDWRPLALASVLIAVHHLALDWLMPGWVFENGRGGIWRVLFHVVAVVLQFAALTYVTLQLRQLVAHQHAARAESERLTAAAEAEREAARVERERAVNALAAARAAEDRSATDRDARRAVEERSEAQRRAELVALAAAFEATVVEVAVAIESASARLEGSATTLNGLAADAGRQASEAASGATQASDAVRGVAAAVDQLTGAIASVAESAEQQSRLTAAARTSAKNGDATVQTLARRAIDIGGFVGEINGIAAQTNLLALNATIEAARAGDAGRGFSVVASEVKQLAGATGRATDKIASLVASVQQGVDAAASDLDAASAAVGQVEGAAEDIRAAVAAQGGTAHRIAQSVHEARTGAHMIAARMGHVAEAVNAAGALSGEVRDAATTLSDHARRLRRSTVGFVEQLRDAQNRAA
ncbi:chemotaxis protein [Sphingomonas sp. MA1305]|uniref:methyl-accepting chemotaxis protein n=1 Tax=Sphingomonas sp. MA1305 TaxID=2479204 RepID=UPI0018DF5473|nr:methyl-accepting chemotaxis protein [Sphingomonas sp. MA1305]MBI0474181.1 chemotaxis protein [Sphingomonas sp. MA1305]